MSSHDLKVYTQSKSQSVDQFTYESGSVEGSTNELCANPFATLLSCSKLFCLHYFVPHILLCCSSMNLKFNIINAIIIGLKLLYLHDEHVSDTVYSSTSTACYHVTHEPNETSFTTSCLSHHNYWNVTSWKVKIAGRNSVKLCIVCCLYRSHLETAENCN